MSIGENKDSIPTDLIVEILSRLPAKPVARFRCLSKQWGSMLHQPHFTELFLTRSLARPPRLLFVIKRLDQYWCFMTSPQPQSPRESLAVTAEFRRGFYGEILTEVCEITSGFICLHGRETSVSDDLVYVPAICNPTTGQYSSLHLQWRSMKSYRRLFLGFDPIEKKVKVLCLNYSFSRRQEVEPHQILTLGTRKWRKIDCPLKSYRKGEGICIDGVLYFLASLNVAQSVISCFDVRSETFKFIYQDFPGRSKLINYKGKLGAITLGYEDAANDLGELQRSVMVCLWVMEGVEKAELSKYASFCLDYVKYHNHSIVGVAAATGEIVLSSGEWGESEPFYLHFLNVERKTVHDIEIKGLKANNKTSALNKVVKVFVDHVEDITFIKLKKMYAATSTLV